LDYGLHVRFEAGKRRKPAKGAEIIDEFGKTVASLRCRKLLQPPERQLRRGPKQVVKDLFRVRQSFGL
jgi:hypothetical protein